MDPIGCKLCRSKITTLVRIGHSLCTIGEVVFEITHLSTFLPAALAALVTEPSVNKVVLGERDIRVPKFTDFSIG